MTRRPLRRYTLIAGTLRISIAGNRLKVHVGDDDAMSITLPADIDPGRLHDHDALAWATLAAVPFADKMLRHRLPEDVQAALRVLADYVMQGGVRHG